MPKVSSLDKLFYSILDDLNIKYYREYNDQPDDPQCQIGPYNFDCVIPRKGKPSLLVEIQGDYWHSLHRSMINDRTKATYIAQNFSNQYELKYLWEHEFKCKDKIIELVKYWVGITKHELIDFQFKDVIIKECAAKDYRLLLAKYHYLPNAGRGGKAFGAYLNRQLIAVCVFSPPIRQNIRTGGIAFSDVKELSRLCIHPRYQKKNFASWFISHCLKRSNHQMTIAYCDTTFNHEGIIYEATNFKLDGIVKADYWYVDNRGWVMHKKTLYEHARKMKMKEREFAEKYNYQKVWGREKKRFIFLREHSL